MKYQVRNGFELNRFWVEFTKSELLPDSEIYINGQFVHCVAKDVVDCRTLIDLEYKKIGVAVKEINLVQPVTTKNEDIKYLKAKNVIGFNQGYIQRIC